MITVEEANRLIAEGREFMKGFTAENAWKEEYKSDQDLKKPQPPLVKAAMSDAAPIRLPRNFEALGLKNDLVALLRDRKSSRVYTMEKMTLLQLSFLLWATQGVKSVRGKNYATLRTVPCGGARHEYETYLLVMNVEGLAPGAYHYLPMEHSIELLHGVEDFRGTVDKTLVGQVWAAKANVIFYWAMNAYRAEWRYTIQAHRPALIDVGHIGQNLYIGCTAMGLGVCGLAAFSHEACNELFGLDGQEEFVAYTAPVGTVSADNYKEEQAFYSFLDEDQGA